MATVAIYGYLSIDRIATPALDVAEIPGGAALYAALGALAAGARIVLVACCGEDYPARWRARMSELGIDLSHLSSVGGASRRAIITHDSGGGRVSSHYDRRDWWERTEALAPPVEAPACHIALLCPMAAAHAARIALRMRAPLVADVSEAFVRREPAAFLDLARRLKLFAPSREETALLLPDLTEDEALRRLAELGCDVVEKRGARGLAWLHAGGAAIGRVATPKGIVVDPTGAGDATVGALAARIAMGDDLAAACRVAVEVGARCVAGVGPQALGFDTSAPIPAI